MLLAQYKQTRQYTESLCAPLNVEDYIPQAVDFTSPPKWHLAHTSWFFEEMILTKFVAGYAVLDGHFTFLFNSYYQSVGEKAVRAQRGLITRPTVEQVYQYRHYVDEHMVRLLSTDVSDEINALVTLGINHEQQHQELLLTDLKYTLSLNPIYPVYRPDFNLVSQCSNAVETPEQWLSIDEGVYEIGHADESFCFDNERGRHKVYLQHFEIAACLVTNGEYIEFIESGGYTTFNYWLDDGWTWIENKQITCPLYWKCVQGQWYYFTLAGLKPIDKQASVSHVSYYEANAFANWKKMRLATEFEWEVASSQFTWGQRWEWTSSAYLAYPGFKVSDGAVGEYNGKFMVNQMVLRGASVASAEQHSRSTYRNFFQPHFQWQYSGIRLVK
ncbi:MULTISPECIES: ergothioneine biosynthesis protein EgtB [Alteromonadales]|uniref:Ergothioneine biosynthesis EgtB family protein n=1 Tax=Alteromonas macleodii TaxID=28108 RepID=A0AB36FSM0_ALTMA|nr:MULTISPECIES: ergothioneine biosynthesis protein EgtB [Alteromonadales]MCC9663197.1 ergothioneine biosynthesis protein EgtB [Pseudoalteromonas sp. MB41]MCO7209106.1 ergothioneine biosynthesis protein EgtB [Pseudoalteromonas sp. CnMc7-37]OES25475.1 ergothioneine biosynthesis EgtB family protein [Alteromonas macleodii]OES25570.1 ergothioneine biosynthesis EgtB family protein [Alteromonas macleodii]OES25964.1 ergothioneine biosynthesis EgtB family protein [Alteromonas macleodii]